MPDMGRDLNGDAELTLTGFLIGFALAQLFWGAVSDKIGRKKPLIIGIVLFIIGYAIKALNIDVKSHPLLLIVSIKTPLSYKTAL